MNRLAGALRPAPLLLSAIAALAACSNGVPLPKAGGEPGLSSDRIDFGTVLVDTAAEAELVLTNRGRDPFRLERVEVGEASTVNLAVEPASADIGVGEQVTLRFSLRSASEVELDTHARLVFSGGHERIVSIVGRVVAASCELAESLRFGKVRVTGSAQRVLSLRNDSGAPLPVELSLSSGFEEQMFRFADGFAAGKRMIAPSETLEVPIVYSPLVIGSHAATLSVLASARCGPRVVLLDGEAVERLVVADVSEVDFGFVHPGQQKIARFRLKNVGSEAVTLDRIRIGFLDSGSAPPATGRLTFPQSLIGSAIPPQGELEVTLTYAAEAVGAITLGIDFVTSDDAGALRLPLKGWVGGPKVSSPAELAFGPVALGTTQRRSLFIRNVGSEVVIGDADNLKLGADSGALAAVEGDAAGEFSVVLPPVGYTLSGIAAGEAQPLEVRFTPKSAGPKSARLIVLTNDPVTPRSEIPLTAMAASYPACALEVSRQSLDFGVVREWSKVELPVLVRNTGTAPTDVCHLFRVELDPAGASSFALASAPAMPMALGPGESATFLVRFTAPKSAHSRSALEISTSSAAQAELRVVLEGFTEWQCLELDRPVLDFGITSPSCAATTMKLALRDSCGSSTLQQIDSLQVRGAFSSAFDVRKAPAVPFHLGPDGYAIPVTFAPTAPGVHEAELLVASSQSGARRVVRLTGRTAASRTERFEPPPQKVDVLWLVDDSGSSPVDRMWAIAGQFSEFMSAAVQQNLDVHVAVTGMSFNCTGCPEGRFVNGRNGSVVGTTPRVLTPQMPDFYTRIRDYFAMGTPGHKEWPLEAMHVALSEPLASGINSGFRREDARLVVIMATDDVESSSRSLEYYRWCLEDLSPGAREVIVSGLVPLLPSSPGNGCAYSSMTAGQSPRFRDFFAMFGGTPEEICTTDMAGSLRRLGAQAFGPRRSFPLAQAAGAVQEVRVGGARLPELSATGVRNWQYDAATRSLVIEPVVGPEPTDAVEVTYSPECNP